uniref:Uncharacterized protein n=1 Tax=Monopterus albus TaxID=43700 RepID=A0A3Q3QVI4_MONAL
MWKSAVGHSVTVKVAAEGDDWETDPDFENDVSEQEQRWGAKTIEGSGRKEHIRKVWGGEGEGGQSCFGV